MLTSNIQPPVSLRPAIFEDLDAILSVEKRVHTVPWEKAHFQGELEKSYSRLWVLTDDETDSIVYGYAVFWVMGESAEVLNIAVDIPHRGLGLAKLMLQQIINEAMRLGLENLMLDVRKSNLPAVGLYQRAGLSITQYRKGFYSNGEDAYHMTVGLTGEATEF
ncbi:MAG: ribosomal protein S18-alanine N-acetyltransferase [Cryobacterium sp.]|nr:ribosomal protein S18-alanine N-acetyltransferase [Oligoflexia bacterium]